MKLCEATLLTSAEKTVEKREKRPKDKTALKSNRASAAEAGAPARVQAQRCNKEEGGWITEEGKWGGWGGGVGGGGGFKGAGDEPPLMCLCAQCHAASLI